jgi:hypothetical protein
MLIHKVVFMLFGGDLDPIHGLKKDNVHQVVVMALLTNPIINVRRLMCCSKLLKL